VKRLVLAALVALVLGFAPNAHALPALINNGGNLIYDPGQNITWYDFIYMGPQSYGAYWEWARDWAASLNAGGVSGWRLPTTPGAATYDSFSSEGEMGQLYVELGNTLGSPGPYSFSPFISSLAVGTYWTSTPFILDRGNGNIFYGWWVYYFNGGGIESGGNYASSVAAIAVHDGDVLGNGVVLANGPAVPIPAAFLLFGSGLLGLVGWRRIRKG
jgi:hypothetical protein